MAVALNRVCLLLLVRRIDATTIHILWDESFSSEVLRMPLIWQKALEIWSLATFLKAEIFCSPRFLLSSMESSSPTGYTPCPGQSRIVACFYLTIIQFIYDICTYSTKTTLIIVTEATSPSYSSITVSLFVDYIVEFETAFSLKGLPHHSQIQKQIQK